MSATAVLFGWSAPPAPVRCRHHWILEVPCGRTSNGICRPCGRSRAFLNAFEDIVEARQRSRHVRVDGRKPAARVFPPPTPGRGPRP
jgi:hypothetical protein